MKSPSFALNKELARYVDEGHRLRGNRTADAAFLDPPVLDPTKEYLSVNSLEVETISVIADYYRTTFQNGSGDVAICTSKIFQFNEAAKKSGVDIAYDKISSSWLFSEKKERNRAYTHRPVVSSKQPKSESHCGVEFIRVLDEHARSKLARRLGSRKFHMMRHRR